MASFGNGMWGTGEINPTNFAVNGTHHTAQEANNTRANPPLTDSFLGAPLATAASSPPAGPLEQSLRGSDNGFGPDGWQSMPMEGKILQPLTSLAIGWAVSKAMNDNALVFLAGTGISFFAIDEIVQRWGA